MARFHLAYKDFDPATLAATEELFAEAPWRYDSDEMKQAAGQRWLDKVCPVYGLPSARLVVGREAPVVVPARSSLDHSAEFDDEDEFDPDDPLAHRPDEQPGSQATAEEERPEYDCTIRLPYWSIIQLFKRFRAHMLDNGVAVMSTARREDDIFGWACSLFYRVKPSMFRARVREGRIKRIHPDELLTRETLRRRREEEAASEHERARQEIEEERDAPFEDVPSVDGDEDDALAIYTGRAGRHVTEMTTRPLRVFATSVGVSNSWSLSKEEILERLGDPDTQAAFLSQGVSGTGAVR